MPRECAFCPATANLTGEHIWSDWMGQCFPGKKVFHNKTDYFEKKPSISKAQSWTANQLNWKAKVVCHACNHGWMSRLEKYLAKPAMSDLIIGKVDVPIDQSRAHDIAVFAFKSAVILDHLAERRQHFFTRTIRYRFRETLEIPDNVNMWLAGYLPRGGGRAASFYFGYPNPKKFEIYVLNYSVGHLVFQLAAFNKPFSLNLYPSADYVGLAVPFWPRFQTEFVWPPSSILHTPKEFEKFAVRWGDLHIRQFT